MKFLFLLLLLPTVALGQIEDVASIGGIKTIPQPVPPPVVPTYPWVTNVVGAPASGSGTYTIGAKFTMLQTVVATAFGRYVYSNSVQTHTINLWTTNGAIIATATLNANGLAQGQQYTNLASPITLTNGWTYVLGAYENNVDKWADAASPITVFQVNGAIADGNVTHGMYTASSNYPSADNGGTIIYDGIDFRYHAP